MLVVDDDPGMRALIARCLAKLEAKVFEADNGSDALDMARKHLPDLILMDNVMPGLKGLDVARELRKDEKLEGTTIVIMSSDPEPEVEDRMKLPYHGWIPKPFNPQLLLEEVTSLVELKRFTPRPFIRRDKS